MISYVKEGTFRSDIFNYYRIKYKIGVDDPVTGEKTYKSVYGHKDQRICHIPIKFDAECLNFHVFGMRTDEQPV
jgi:hypothetical protein